MSTNERQFGLPNENQDVTQRFVENALGTDNFELTIHDSQGYKTRVYACESVVGSFILRHGYDRTGLEKDRFVGERFEDQLPVPKVLSVMRLDDKSALCIAERIPGDIANPEELAQVGMSVNTSLNTMLRQIHTADVSGTSGYGFAKATGQGLVSKNLHRLGVQQRAAMRYWGVYAARNTSVIDRSSFREIMALQRSLADFSVLERRLCHGDVKDSNLLVDQGQISGVIDWARFGYGDPMYDLGILHARYPGAVDAEAHCEQIGLDTENLRDRVLYFAIGECTVGLGFFGQQGNEQKVAQNEQRLLEIVDEAES